MNISPLVEARLGHLLAWLLLGTAIAFLVILASLPPLTANVPTFLAADIAAVGVGACALIALFWTWEAMTENE